jgi:hypothetical protein
MNFCTRVLQTKSPANPGSANGAEFRTCAALRKSQIENTKEIFMPVSYWQMGTTGGASVSQWPVHPNQGTGQMRPTIFSCVPQWQGLPRRCDRYPPVRRAWHK